MRFGSVTRSVSWLISVSLLVVCVIFWLVWSSLTIPRYLMKVFLFQPVNKILFLFDMICEKRGVKYSVAWAYLWWTFPPDVRVHKFHDCISVWHFTPQKYSLPAQKMLLSLLFSRFLFVAMNSCWSAQHLNSSLKYALRFECFSADSSRSSQRLVVFVPTVFPCHQHIRLRWDVFEVHPGM